MATQIQTDAEREVVEFLAGQPSPHDILEFHPSPEVAARAHELLRAERQNDLSAAERRELDSYEYLEHFMRRMKAAARRRLTRVVDTGRGIDPLAK